MRANLGILVGFFLCSACSVENASVESESTEAQGISGGALVRLIKASSASSFAPGCTGGDESSVNANAEVEPVIVKDTVHGTLVAAWQEDRFSSGGGGRGIVNAYSTDRGRTWNRVVVPFSRCGGGTVANGGDWERATNSTLSVGRDGTVYQVTLAFNTGPGGSVVATRSTDGGKTWSPTIALRTDLSGTITNDKPTVTADPRDARFVFATWHRTDCGTDPACAHTQDPTWFTRSINGGATWETAQSIFDPGTDGSTLYDQVAVLPNGHLVLGLTAYPSGSASNERPLVLRSTNHGATWSAPIFVDGLIPAGGQPPAVKDPTTGAPIRALGTMFLAADPRRGFETVYAAYLDNRTGVARVSLSQSKDDGVTWSPAVRVNSLPAVQAFPQALAVNGGGVVGVLFDDLRNDTPDPAILQTNAFVATCNPTFKDCTLSASWTESAVGDTFDISAAPKTSLGFTLGDAQGLVGDECGFDALVTIANRADAANRTDIFLKRAPANGFPGDQRGYCPRVPSND